MWPSSAEAQRGRWGRPHRIEGVRPEIHMSLGPGFGTGVQFGIPVVPDGFLQRGPEDEFVISPGFEFYFVDFDDNLARRYEDDDNFDPAFGPFVVARWNVYVHDKWSVFPEAGFTVMIAEDDFIYHGHDGNDDFDVFADAVIGAGARWHFSDRGALVMRLVYPFGFQFGVNF
jgi:hypothetical protein